MHTSDFLAFALLSIFREKIPAIKSAVRCESARATAYDSGDKNITGCK